MSEEPGTVPVLSRKVSRSRSERRSKRLDSRRRRRSRLVVATLAAVVVIASVAAGALFLLRDHIAGGDEVASMQAAGVALVATGADASATGSTDAPAQDKVVPGSVLIVTGGDQVAAVITLQPRAQGGGVVIAMPPHTVVKTAAGFQTLATLHATGDEEALVDAIGSILGASPDAIGRSEMSALQVALAERSGAAQLLDAGDPTDKAMLQMASAVLALTGLVSPQQGGDFGDLLVGGGSVKESVAHWSGDPSGRPWEAVALPGTSWEGSGFTYYEADLARTRALLLGRGAVDIILQVQNGSGVVGAAEAAGALLAPLGHTMAAFANALDFPKVEMTRIEAAPGFAATAEQVRVLLGVGRVTEQTGLEAGSVVVVVGRDFVLPSKIETATTTNSET